MKLEDFYIEKDVTQITETPWQLSFFTELEGENNPIINQAIHSNLGDPENIYRKSKNIKINFSYENNDNSLSEFSIKTILTKELLINLDYNVLVFKINLNNNLIKFLKAIKEKNRTKISIDITRDNILGQYKFIIAPSYKTSGKFSDYNIKLHGNTVILNLDTRNFIENK